MITVVHSSAIAARLRADLARCRVALECVREVDAGRRVDLGDEDDEPIALAARLAATGKLVRASSIAIPGAPDVGPSWVQIALAGEYKGYGGGAFTFDDQVFADLIKNLHAHPSYRSGADGIGTEDIIQWDFNHASASYAADGSIPLTGTPAQGWIRELGIRPSPQGSALWALTNWLEPARTYIKENRYRWASVVVSFDCHDAITNLNIGAVLSSVALTNQPFIEGMVPLVASKHGAQPKKEPTMSQSRIVGTMRLAKPAPPLFGADSGGPASGVPTKPGGYGPLLNDYLSQDPPKGAELPRIGLDLPRELAAVAPPGVIDRESCLAWIMSLPEVRNRFAGHEQALSVLSNTVFNLLADGNVEATIARGRPLTQEQHFRAIASTRAQGESADHYVARLQRLSGTVATSKGAGGKARVDLSKQSGRNRTERACSHIRATIAGADRWTFDDVFAAATELLRTSEIIDVA